MADIVINAEPVEVLQVDLVGQTYMVKPPKSALALKIAVRSKTAGDDPVLVLEAINEWISKSFGKSAKAINARLDDSADLLDISHIMALMEAMIERAAANPTTSSSGLRALP